MTTHKNTHAVIYDRASTEQQRDNFSRVNAREMGIRIAEQNGFTWDYVKEIGSGTTLTGRPQMMRILDRIAAGEVQALIVQEMDRLARPEEPVVYATIRNTIMQYGVIIYTHTSRIDLNNDDDDFVADITMSVAKKERRRILKRAKRGREARAESGKFMGGYSPTGYAVVGNGSKSDFVIDPEGANLVRLIFNTLEDEGGNLCGTAKRLNAMGYTGDRGRPFSSNGIKDIATRKLYIGIFQSSVTDKVTHRPDLQIIGIDLFSRVQGMVNSRGMSSNPAKGIKGRYIFTGFACCGSCGGPMVAGDRGNGDIRYQCANYRRFGKAGCENPKTYAERLILAPIVEGIANVIQSHLDLRAAMQEAAAQYGKSVTEEALEAAVQGELESVKAGKQRIVDAISLGVLTVDEAAAKLNELREQEQRLIVEVASIGEKTAIMESWQTALDSLESRSRDEIVVRLQSMAEDTPMAFRRFLSIMFEPNSLRVRTELGKGRKWGGVFESYQLTPAMKELQKQMKAATVSSDNSLDEPFEFLCLVPNKPDKIEILG